jgi:hypothetical protein
VFFISEPQGEFPVPSESTTDAAVLADPSEVPAPDPEAVRGVIESLYPEPELRDRVLDMLGESIEKAHDTNPSSWGLELDAGRRQMWLHVGRVFALSLQPGDIAVTLVDDGLSAPTHSKGISGEIAGAFRPLPGVVWHRLDPQGLIEQWPELRSAHLDAVEQSAKQVRRTAYLLFHQPAVLEGLAELMDRTPPVPDHDLVEPGHGERPAPAKGLSGTKLRELRSQLGELLESYLPTPEGQRLLGLYRRTHLEARRRFRRILETEQRGDEVADAVFRGLLPHADTEENERMEAWIWPGGSLPYDALGWLMERHGARPEDGPRIATAALDFVRHNVEDPSSLPDICRGFAGLPYTEGLDASLLTPALAALRPQEFLAMDPRTRRVVNYLAGTRFRRDLSDYPTANAAGRELLDRFADDLKFAEELDILPADLFHLFAHWLTRVVQHPLEGTRFWWVRSGGDDEEWRAALRSGFVSLDEGLALGDLSKLDRREFDQRRTELGEHDDALWKFSREIAEGDRVVAIRGGQVAAIGTVSGDYGFARGAASGHFLPVEWDDTHPRELLDPGHSGVVTELDPEGFEALLHREPPDAAEVTDVTADDSIAETIEEALGEPETGAAIETTDEEAVEAVVETVDVPGPEAAGSDDGGVVPPAAAEPETPLHATVTLLHPFLSLDRMAELTHLDPDELEHWVDLVQRRRQVAFQGPPGTGKTYIARHLARHLMSGSEGVLEILPLHAAVGYRDLFGEPGSGQAPGRLAEFCRRAVERRGTSVLLLDDLHRVDPAALGEVFYLLDHRGEAVNVASGGRLTVAPEVVVLGTWTTSAATPAPDPAFARRFAFVSLPPRYDVLERFLTASTEGDKATEKARAGFARRLVTVLRTVNEEIGDPRLALGIAPFLDPELAEHLSDVWTTEIEPLLEERFRDRPDTLKRFRWDRLRESLGPDAATDEDPVGNPET